MKESAKTPPVRIVKEEVKEKPVYKAPTAATKALGPVASDADLAPHPFEPEHSLFGPQTAESMDRAVHALIGRLTAGLSPAALAIAYLDWAVHLAMAPGKQMRLVEKGFRKALRLGMYAGKSMADPNTQPCIEPLPQDRRFDDPAWQKWPYSLIYQSFLLTQQWWYNATTGVRGVSKQNEHIVEFASRQLLDMFSPSNFLFTNPEILRVTLNEGGQNLTRGLQNFIEDWERAVTGGKTPGTETFRPGVEVALTPGKVVYRNRLIELIQYAPAADTVYPEPVLIVPAWIMKYYILDLSPHNSLIKYLVDQGHTVFVVSWKNPGVEERDLGMEDYRRLGVMAALDAVEAIVSGQKIHTVGYCLGGTLLSIAAAAMARDGDERIKTMTLLAAQTDFTEAGELMLFINMSQLTFLEDMMWDQGYLETKQMAGAFQLLRSNDLIWSRMVHDYLLGKRQSLNDLMAWNADQTRMPYRMHSEYLRRLFLDNELAGGRYEVNGRPIAITDIRAPIFAVGATKDHVAPWKSVYKIHLLTDAEEVSFLLASGGHNAGIVSQPGRSGRSYQMSATRETDRYVDPDSWRLNTPSQAGSWWPAWQQWLAQHSGAKIAPPAMGAPQSGYAPVCDAPGAYIYQE